MAMYDSDNSGSSEEDQLEDIHEEALEQFEQSQEVWEENQRRL